MIKIDYKKLVTLLMFFIYINFYNSAYASSVDINNQDKFFAQSKVRVKQLEIYNQKILQLRKQKQKHEKSIIEHNNAIASNIVSNNTQINLDKQQLSSNLKYNNNNNNNIKLHPKAEFSIKKIATNYNTVTQEINLINSINKKKKLNTANKSKDKFNTKFSLEKQREQKLVNKIKSLKYNVLKNQAEINKKISLAKLYKLFNNKLNIYDKYYSESNNKKININNLISKNNQSDNNIINKTSNIIEICKTNRTNLVKIIDDYQHNKIIKNKIDLIVNKDKKIKEHKNSNILSLVKNNSNSNSNSNSKPKTLTTEVISKIKKDAKFKAKNIEVSSNKINNNIINPVNSNKHDKLVIKKEPIVEPNNKELKVNNSNSIKKPIENSANNFVIKEYAKPNVSEQIKILTRDAKNYVNLGIYDKAKELYNKILDLDNKNIKAYKGLIRLHFILADYQSAEKIIYKALLIKPSDQSLILANAKLMLINKQYSKAIQLLENYSPEIKSNPEFYATLAHAYSRSKMYNKAVTAYRLLTENFEYNGNYWFGLAYNLEKTGKKNIARDYYIKGLETRNIKRELASYANSRITGIIS